MKRGLASLLLLTGLLAQMIAVAPGAQAFHDPYTWHLRETPTSPGPSDGDDIHPFKWGNRPDYPLVGDWDGPGDGNEDTVGVGIIDGIHRRWHLNDENTDDYWDHPPFKYGRARDWFVAGDFNGDGMDSVGTIHRRGDGIWSWRLNNELDSGPADQVFDFGRWSKRHIPVVGDWDGNGTTDPGVVSRIAKGRMKWYLGTCPGGAAPPCIFDINSVVFGNWDHRMWPVAGNFIPDDDAFEIAAVRNHDETWKWYMANPTTNFPGIAKKVAYGNAALGQFPIPGDYTDNVATEWGVGVIDKPPPNVRQQENSLYV